MEEMVQGSNQGQESSLPGTTSSSAPTSAPEERVFRQPEVNDLVGRARREGAEAAERRFSQQNQQQNYGQNQAQGSSTSSQGLDESAYRKMAAEEAQRLVENIKADAQSQAESDAAQRIVQNFWNKITPGKEKYEDFEKVTGDIEYSRFPNTVQLLADYVDNSADVLYELGKDRFKISQLEQLSMMSPKDAIIQVQRLAESIKDNQQAGKMRHPNEPLSQVRPSNASADSGPMSVSDYRKKYKI
jgi:hypothetical protein